MFTQRRRFPPSQTWRPVARTKTLPMSHLVFYIYDISSLRVLPYPFHGVYKIGPRAQSYKGCATKCRTIIPRHSIYGTLFTQSYKENSMVILFTPFCPRYKSTPAGNTQRDWSMSCRRRYWKLCVLFANSKSYVF